MIIFKNSEEDYSSECARKIRPNGSFTQGNGVQVVRRVSSDNEERKLIVEGAVNKSSATEEEAILT